MAKCQQESLATHQTRLHVALLLSHSIFQFFYMGQALHLYWKKITVEPHLILKYQVSSHKAASIYFYRLNVSGEAERR